MVHADCTFPRQDSSGPYLDMEAVNDDSAGDVHQIANARAIITKTKALVASSKAD